MAVIEASGLTKEYGSVRATDDLSFTVESGEIFGYLGPNGAGKTTTIRMLLGFVTPTMGTGRVLDQDIRDRTGLRKAKTRIGYLPDSPSFDGQARGADILRLHGAIKGDERREELLDRFDPPLERRVRDYSHGNVQKLGIVTAFMHDPELLILDEPTSGLDPLMRHRLAELLREERDRGRTILFSSHVLSEVRRLCDRVGIIRRGELVTVEPVASVIDRSGKVVRIQSRAPIPVEALDLAGVHDLETTLDDPSTPAEEAGFTECTFTFTGDINALLARLPEHDLVDIAIEEAPLEDVFLRFYGEETDV